MLKLIKAFFFLALLAIASACKTADPAPVPIIQAPLADHPKNIILLIGDGMGLSQISAGLYHNNNRLSLEKFPVVGLHKSHSADYLVTDSAAGATAFSCGRKTLNGTIGITPDSLACKTILEEMEEKQYATGLVVTSTIVHATPAAFFAHQPLRVFYENIALDLAQKEVDLFIGGGLEYFNNRNLDKRDLVQELKDKGYKVGDYSKQPLKRFLPDPKQNFAYFTAQTQPEEVLEGRNYLPSASLMAAEFLSQRSEKGFFLMVEGSQIDWAGHANNEQSLLQELTDFDKTVNNLLNFARKRGDTLVIVTADHETGGLSINEGSKMGRLRLAFNLNDHTATMIPVFAYGPQAQLFSGIYENIAIHDKMREAMGWEAAHDTSNIQPRQ
ncbi:MAG: alkaline phosphatase [Saprospiraceae bacterium]